MRRIEVLLHEDERVELRGDPCYMGEHRAVLLSVRLSPRLLEDVSFHTLSFDPMGQGRRIPLGNIYERTSPEAPEAPEALEALENPEIPENPEHSNASACLTRAGEVGWREGDTLYCWLPQSLTECSLLVVQAEAHRVADGVCVMIAKSPPFELHVSPALTGEGALCTSVPPGQMDHFMAQIETLQARLKDPLVGQEAYDALSAQVAETANQALRIATDTTQALSQVVAEVSLSGEKQEAAQKELESYVQKSILELGLAVNDVCAAAGEVYSAAIAAATDAVKSIPLPGGAARKKLQPGIEFTVAQATDETNRISFPGSTSVVSTTSSEANGFAPGYLPLQSLDVPSLPYAWGAYTGTYWASGTGQRLWDLTEEELSRELFVRLHYRRPGNLLGGDKCELTEKRFLELRDAEGRFVCRILEVRGTIVHDTYQAKIRGQFAQGVHPQTGEPLSSPTLCSYVLFVDEVVPGSTTGRLSLECLFMELASAQVPPLQAITVTFAEPQGEADSYDLALALRYHSLSGLSPEAAQAQPWQAAQTGLWRYSTQELLSLTSQDRHAQQPVTVHLSDQNLVLTFTGENQILGLAADPVLIRTL